MWAGAVLWQIGYDSIYAYVDVRDDLKLGLRSTAMRFAERGKTWIGGFYLATLALWAWAGWALGAGWGYAAGMAALAAHFGWQLALFDLQKPDRNFMLFRANLWVGVLMIAAALAGAWTA
jgi:4-hydroxybenzoate polyprenyltransferase